MMRSAVCEYCRIIRASGYHYLREIDAQASGQLDVLITRMAGTEGVTEQLKAENQLEWIRCMNNIRNRAEEIVYSELITY